MAWSFRKRIKIAPGVSINLSKSGVSTSIGPKGAKINVGPKGSSLYTSIPGTGLYYRGKLSDGEKSKTSKSATNPGPKSTSAQNKKGAVNVGQYSPVSDALEMANQAAIRRQIDQEREKFLSKTKYSEKKQSKPFLSGWMDPNGRGSLFYGILGRWSRFLIWIAFFFFLVLLYNGISDGSLKWWGFTLYSSLAIGSLLLLWRINGGTLNQQPNGEPFFIVVCTSFAMLFWITILNRTKPAIFYGSLATLLILSIILFFSIKKIWFRLFPKRKDKLVESNSSDDIPPPTEPSKTELVAPSETPSETIDVKSTDSSWYSSHGRYTLSPKMQEIIARAVKAVDDEKNASVNKDKNKQ